MGSDKFQWKKGDLELLSPSKERNKKHREFVRVMARDMRLIDEGKMDPTPSYLRGLDDSDQ